MSERKSIRVGGMLSVIGGSLGLVTLAAVWAIVTVDARFQAMSQGPNPQTAISGHLDKGDAYFDQGNYQAALTEYDLAVELLLQHNVDRTSGPGAEYDRHPLFSRGKVYCELGDYESAIADFTQLIEIEPDVWAEEGYTLRAMVYAEIGDHESAIADLSRSIEQNRYGGVEMNFVLCYRCKFQAALGNYEKALADCAHGLETSPLPFCNNVRGFVYYEMGDLDAALGEFNQWADSSTGFMCSAYNINTLEMNSSYALYGRGLVHEAQGEIEEALADYRRFLEELTYGGCWQYNDALPMQHVQSPPEVHDARARIEALGSQVP